jgi:hypothetical protein
MVSYHVTTLLLENLRNCVLILSPNIIARAHKKAALLSNCLYFIINSYGPLSIRLEAGTDSQMVGNS